MLNLLDVCTGYLGASNGIPDKLAFIVALVIRIIQIGVPILLIVWGMLDLGKAVMTQKEDEIKKGQNTFIKRLIAAIIVFFVITITKLIVGVFAGDVKGASSKKEETLWNCVESIISCKNANNCE